MAETAEEQAAFDDDDLGIYGSDDEPFCERVDGDGKADANQTFESTALMDTTCATESDRQNLQSGGSMGTVMSSEYGFDCLNLDTIGEELACRAVEFSLSDAAGPSSPGSAPGPRAESVAVRSDEPRQPTPEIPAPAPRLKAPTQPTQQLTANLHLRKESDAVARVIARSVFRYASQAPPPKDDAGLAIESEALAPAVPEAEAATPSPLRAPPGDTLCDTLGGPLGSTEQVLDMAAINASIQERMAAADEQQRPATRESDGVAEFSVRSSEMTGREAAQTRLSEVAEGNDGASAASDAAAVEQGLPRRVAPAEALGETTGGPCGATSKALDEALVADEDPFRLAAPGEAPPKEDAAGTVAIPQEVSGEAEEQPPVQLHSNTQQFLSDAIEGVTQDGQSAQGAASTQQTLLLGETAGTVGSLGESAQVAAAAADAAPGYIRDTTLRRSATSLGREHQMWASNVLGKLAQDAPYLNKRKLKPGRKRLSTGSIIRALGCLPSLQGSMSSPSVAANSIAGQQSTNSIRSPLTSPSSSQCVMHQSTWTPPSPPAPSSTRTADSQRVQRVSSLPAIPAAGLRVSPCSSANTQRASSAQHWRSAVPGLDLTRVKMGFDDDEDTEDDPTGGPELAGNPASGTRNPDVPQLDMSSLQFDASKATRSSGARTGASQLALAPRDLSNPASSPPEPVSPNDAWLAQQDPAPVSEQPFPAPAPLEPRAAAPGGDLRPVVPGPRELAALEVAAVQPPSASGSSQRGREGKPGYMQGYPNSNFVSFTVDAMGSVVAGAGEGQKTALDVPARVRLPPVNKGPKMLLGGPGKQRSAIISHVHMHHHHHYHVTKPAAETDLKGSASMAGPGVPGAGGVAAGV